MSVIDIAEMPTVVAETLESLCRDGYQLCSRPASFFSVDPDEQLRPALVWLEAQIAAAAVEDKEREVYRTQVLNHVCHASLLFRFDQSEVPYSHALAITGPFSRLSASMAILKAVEFLETATSVGGFSAGAQGHVVAPAFGDVERVKYSFDDQQLEVKRRLLSDPLATYQQWSTNLSDNGPLASFVEFRPVAAQLATHLHQVVVGGVSTLTASRALSAYNELMDAISQACPYLPTLLAIELGLEVLDVIERSSQEMPSLYHSGRYEYYWHWLATRTDHICFPTGLKFGATDLIALRGVPVGVLGVNLDTQRVDGFKQSPYEFFHHDVNHSRRMYQFFVEQASQTQTSVLDLAHNSSNFIATTLMPALRPGATKSQTSPSEIAMLRMLIFEILHEDALVGLPEVMKAAMFRAPMTPTPFERMDGRSVSYFMEPGATTLAYVFRKLAHTFYDDPTQRSGFLGSETARSRKAIAKAGLALYRLLVDQPFDRQAVTEQLEQLVATDQGFPDAFFADVLADIDNRAAEREYDFAFLVSNPLQVDSAVEQARAIRPQLHALFGYSDQGYADTDLMRTKVRAELAKLDPKAVAIVIGATPEGIGGAYFEAKSFGFETVGIVSSTSLVDGGHYSPLVDHVIIVEDHCWGGLDPTRGSGYSATTEVFVKASSSFSAFGGGEITKVSMQFARSLAKPVTVHQMANASGVMSHIPVS